MRKLRLLGAHVELDDSGQARRIGFAGTRFNDATVEQLAGIAGVESIDIRDTAITPLGAKRLQELMPGVAIQFRE